MKKQQHAQILCSVLPQTIVQHKKAQLSDCEEHDFEVISTYDLFPE
jgi:hypothetical protein